jgi:hypothetical protein
MHATALQQHTWADDNSAGTTQATAGEISLAQEVQKLRVRCNRLRGDNAFCGL